MSTRSLIDKRNSEVTKERRDGTFVLAQSIPYFESNESGGNLEGDSAQAEVPIAVIVGYFKVPKTIVGIYEPLAISGLISLLLALSAFFFLYKMISRPVGQLSEQLDAALKGEDVQLVCGAKFPELETLAKIGRAHV